MLENIHLKFYVGRFLFISSVEWECRVVVFVLGITPIGVRGTRDLNLFGWLDE